jgi:hypothetical protein
MFVDLNVDDFDCQWKELVAEFGSEDNNWMHELYEKRKI